MVPSPPEALSPDLLHRHCDPALLPFATTAEVIDADIPAGQDRAVEAIRFAIGMRHRGFNLFALGPEGTGRRSMVTQFLTQAAAGRPVPDDWVYVNNFDDSNKPRAMRLPPGRAQVLKKDMIDLVRELGVALPAAFETEEYRNRRHALEEGFKERQEAAINEAQRKANEHGVALVRTAVGLALAPMKDGEVLNPDEFQRLHEDEKERFKAEMAQLEEMLGDTLKAMPQWEREIRAKLRELDQEVVAFAVSHLMDELREKYRDQPDTLEFLDRVAKDAAEHVSDFLPTDEDKGKGKYESLVGAFRRYRVNVLVDNANCAGAPVIYADNPTQPNLVGRVEHIQQYGALVTDFNLIKPGALHQANGGYLILDARKLLMQPFAWEDLKRALKAREICIESPGQSMGLLSTVSLQPEPIALDAKVVLIGDPMLYYLLAHHDPEFAELFKVSADFDWRMDRTPDNVLGLARSIAALTRKEHLRPLDRSAVARLVEQASRDAEDADKLSTHMASLADLVRESDYWAGQADAEIVRASHVEKAIEASIYRQDRVREHVQEEIGRGTVHIATDGAEIGQINGLAVLQLGRFSFGRPSRITARARLGRGEVLDIEREVQLGGPLHGKGVLILSSFLASRFGSDAPLSLSASLVFEQSYGGVDGDSASSTELYCLMSALAEVPLRQDLAVTGSVDQYGNVQAIGGVNHKIEGFFDLCQRRGLTGSQGVLIPATNVKHLMLRKDVVQACADGRFHVYAIETIDQGIALLTGIAAGEADGKGDYPAGTVNRRIQARLARYTQIARQTDRRGRGGNGKGEPGKTDR